MIKYLNKEIFVFILLIALTMRGFSQLVTIPDPAFVVWLQTNSPGCMTGDQLEISCPDVLNRTSIAINGSNIANFNGLQYFTGLLTLNLNNMSSLTTLPAAYIPPGVNYLYVMNSPGFTSFESFPTGLNYLDCRMNNLNALPVLPAGVYYLNCSYNSLPSLPALPSALTYLFCDGNQLTDLPPLPAGLVTLSCWQNQLTSLPPLPSTLQTLGLTANQVTSIPPLPATLIDLSCSGNQITSLPPLPAGLRQLICSDNNITALPASLPPTLQQLWCGLNELQEIPPLPASVFYFRCESNWLDSLPELPAALTRFYCGNNQITELPSIPAGVYQLDCSSNPIGVLPALPPALVTLDCTSNMLLSIPALPASVKSLACSYNYLTSLPNLPAGLVDLNCSHNSITQLPPLPSSMVTFRVDYNPQLYCIPPLEQFTGSFSSWFAIGHTGITCLPNIIQHTGYIASIDTMDICGIFNSSGCEVAWNIQGNVRQDINENCLENGADIFIPSVKLQLIQDGIVNQQVYSNLDGSFSFNTVEGNFQVKVDTAGLPFSVLCPLTDSITVNIIPNDSLYYLADFGLKCRPGEDYTIQSIVNTTFFVPDMVAVLQVNVTENSLLYGVDCAPGGQQGVISLNFTGPAYLTEVPIGATIVDGGFTWTVDDLSLIDPVEGFTVKFITDTTAQIGDEICTTFNLTLDSGTDNYLGNNQLTQCFPVFTSFDPNYKEVSPEKISAPGEEWHIYTIHFQNTGTFAAQNIQLIDTLDQRLNWSTFQRTASSHTNLTQILENGIVHFSFPNIQLPDSVSDEPNSKGWIQFKIKTNNSISINTSIPNRVAIYFDFNPPVLTNYAIITYCTNQTYTQNIQLCPGDSVAVGENWYTHIGNYSDTLNSAFGCDSLVFTSIIEEINELSISIEGNTLVASQGFNSYQWFDCLEGTIIPGEISQEITIPGPGSYGVTANTVNDCIVISPCFEILITSQDIKNENNFHFYPNPTTGNLRINYPGGSEAEIAVVTDLSGRVLLSQKMISQTTQNIDLDHLDSGIFLLKLYRHGSLVRVEKIVIAR